MFRRARFLGKLPAGRGEEPATGCGYDPVFQEREYEKMMNGGGTLAEGPEEMSRLNKDR
jgi:hypothetical protein